MTAATVGCCEWCGLLDHHLIDGECGSCRAECHPLHRNRTHGEGIRVEELRVERVRLAPAPRREARR
jgi:hypothetical protein